MSRLLWPVVFQMKAVRIHRFGPPDVLMVEDLPRPSPQSGEVLVRVSAAGVGPWDAWIREGKSKVNPPLPITLGSDIAGIVEAVGPDVSTFAPGDEVYGVPNPQFCGGYAEYAIASAGMIARKPSTLSLIEAASVPVVAVTAWQMLFDYAHAKSRQTVLIHGAAGNVGAHAVRLAKDAGLKVFTTASGKDIPIVQRLGADEVIDYRRDQFEKIVPPVDIVLDTVGGDTKRRSFDVLKDTGILVSAVSANASDVPAGREKQAVFFLVEVTTERLNKISELFEDGKLSPQVGSVLRLSDARRAHEMLAGAPHERGKIVLQV
jgi:NADPH:quinone reductase-like Zn-dependent oxidoreductase